MKTAKIAQKIRQYTQYTKGLKASLLDDKAAFVKHAFEEARKNGPGDIATLVRGIVSRVVALSRQKLHLS